MEGFEWRDPSGGIRVDVSEQKDPSGRIRAERSEWRDTREGI